MWTRGNHLYDPTYIDDDDDDFGVNPLLVADNYTNETAAYEALSNFQGYAFFVYYGPYSLDIPIESAERSVRLTLIELTSGGFLSRNGSEENAYKIDRYLQDLLTNNICIECKKL